MSVNDAALTDDELPIQPENSLPDADVTPAEESPVQETPTAEDTPAVEDTAPVETGAETDVVSAVEDVAPAGAEVSTAAAEAASADEDEFADADDAGFEVYDGSQDEPDEADEEAEVDGADEEKGPALPFRRGEIIEGLVLETSPTEVLIDIDGQYRGIVSARELERMDAEALNELQVGRKVLAYVLTPMDRSGNVVLSLNRALEERDWRRALEFKDRQDVYDGKVSGYNRGGLIVRFGRVRGFVPASQVSKERLDRAVGDSPQERWGHMVGHDITVKVMEVNRQRNRLILSERMAVKETRDQRKVELLESLNVGDIRKGRVVNLSDFGAFVDLGGADGLVHLTELSWRHVNHPRDVLKIGQEVEVEVISLDRARRRIGLSMKSLMGDPWDEIVRNFQVNQLVQGRVTKLTRFGAFVCLNEAPEIEGLVHISELSDRRVNHPREVVNEEEELTLRIVKIDRVQRRMGLSLKQVNAVDYLELDLANYEETETQVPVLDDEAAESEDEE